MSKIRIKLKATTLFPEMNASDYEHTTTTIKLLGHVDIHSHAHPLTHLQVGEIIAGDL